MSFKLVSEYRWTKVSSYFSSLDISVGLPLSIEIISLISDITMKGFTGSEYSHWFSLNFCLCCSNLSEFEINLNNSSIAAWQAAGLGLNAAFQLTHPSPLIHQLQTSSMAQISSVPHTWTEQEVKEKSQSGQHTALKRSTFKLILRGSLIFDLPLIQLIL